MHAAAARDRRRQRRLLVRVKAREAHGQAQEGPGAEAVVRLLRARLQPQGKQPPWQFETSAVGMQGSQGQNRAEAVLRGC